MEPKLLHYTSTNHFLYAFDALVFARLKQNLIFGIARQSMAMKKHGKHHTAKHLRAMVVAMKKGESFAQSHKTAMKKAGK